MQTIGGFWAVLLSFWVALAFSIAYGATSYFIVLQLTGTEDAFKYIEFFIFSYGGLVAGTSCGTLFLMSIFVLRLAPTLIEDAIPNLENEEPRYKFWKVRGRSFFLDLSQFTTYFAAATAIYSLLEFPVGETARICLIVFTSIQYGFGGFVGRKLWCIAHMLRSAEGARPSGNLLETESLPKLIYIVNIFTFITLLMTGIHTYFHSTIDYELGTKLAVVLRPIVYLPLILALPVIVLFNFYPRMVVNRLYLKSIRQRKEWLSRKMLTSKESEISKIKYTIDYEKYLNEEFRYRQRVALSELPVALTITIAVIATAVRVLAR